MKSRFWLFSLVLIFMLGLTSCEKEEPTPPLPIELITTVNYTLTPDDGSENVTVSFTDIDGDGGNEPIIVGGTLKANVKYSATLEFLNESIDPVNNINLEILEENEEHQVFFATTISDLTIAYDDQDPMGNPLGLQSTVSTGGAGSCDITIILRHEPDKTASGVSAGDITNAGGETDIEVTFPIEVQ